MKCCHHKDLCPTQIEEILECSHHAYLGLCQRNQPYVFPVTLKYSKECCCYSFILSSCDPILKELCLRKGEKVALTVTKESDDAEFSISVCAVIRCVEKSCNCMAEPIQLEVVAESVVGMAFLKEQRRCDCDRCPIC